MSCELAYQYWPVAKVWTEVDESVGTDETPSVDDG